VLSALLLLSVSACTLRVDERNFLYPGPARNPSRATFDAPAEDHVVTATDGVKLGAVYVRQTAAPVDILYFGGDSFRIDDFGPWIAKAALPLGVNLFMIDHRGYGRSAGMPTLSNFKGDVLAAYDYLREHNNGRPIVVHGFSLGSFLAAHVAANRPVAGLVLESTATDVPEWAQAQIPGYAKPVVRLKIAQELAAESNRRVVRQYRGPLLLLVGSKDRVTPSRFAHALLKESATPPELKRVFVAEGKDHGYVMTSEAAVAEYGAFVRLVAETVAAAPHS
jgi:pimeloyl-ACP methyl ester carboxylesterase